MEDITTLYIMGTRLVHHHVIDSISDACEGIKLVRNGTEVSDLKMNDPAKLNEAGSHLVDAIKCLMDSFIAPPGIDPNKLAEMNAEVSEVISELQLWFK